jgi:hypothetical protein
VSETVSIQSAARGYTTADIALRYRVGEDRVRGWIRAGLLRAVNTADARCGRPRFVVPPEAIQEFERIRAAAEPSKPAPRRKRQAGMVDFIPD